MTIIQKNKIFDSIQIRNSGKIFSGYCFDHCKFIGSDIISTSHNKRNIIKNMTLSHCEEKSCSIHGAIIEDTLIDGIKSHDLFQIWGTVFKKVVLKGNIGRLMISPRVFIVGFEKEQQYFDKANNEYYEKVEWALDIREASFFELDIRNIPSRLILRDSDTQAVVKLEKAVERKWENLDLSGSPWSMYIQFLIENQWPDVILVAPKSRPKAQYHAWLDGIKRLRDAGVAETD
jgi:hypothetical protein